VKFTFEQIDQDHYAGIHIASMDELKAVADECAGLRGIGATGSKDMKLAARIPEFIVMRYINDNGITWADFIRDPKHADRMLADPSLSAFRVWEGRV
jgi:hypothetical protein